MHNGTLAWGYFRGMTPLPPSFYFRLTAPGKKACTERKNPTDLMERIRAGVMRLSIE